MHDQDIMLGELFNASDLDCQQGMFMVIMKSNVVACMAPPFNLNPLTKMWRLSSRVFSFSFPKYVKLVELVMVQIVGSVEDERCLSILAFTNSKLWNKLTTHLPLLCTCLHNNSILCKISHMQIILSNGEKLAINIVMMAKQYTFCVATLALGSRPRQGVARLWESRGKKPESQKEGSPGAKAKALEECGPRGSPGVITYSRESKEVRGSVRE